MNDRSYDIWWVKAREGIFVSNFFMFGHVVGGVRIRGSHQRVRYVFLYFVRFIIVAIYLNLYSGSLESSGVVEGT